MITIACVLKHGGDYDERYVKSLHESIGRNIHDYKFDFICLSGVYNALNQLTDNWQGWWSKIELFKLVGKVLYFDLDTVILHNIDYMFELTNRLATNEFIGIKSFNPTRNQKEETIFASGIMAWNGDFRFVYDNFDYHKEKIGLGKGRMRDQDYISRELRARNIKIKFWQDEMGGIYSYKNHCKEGLPASARVVCFHGHPRPHEVMHLDWVKENWGE